MNVLDGLVETLDQLDGALETAVLGPERFSRWRAECQVLSQRRTRIDFDLEQHKMDDEISGDKRERKDWDCRTPSALSMEQTSAKKVPLVSKSSWIRSVSIALHADG